MMQRMTGKTIALLGGFLMLVACAKAGDSAQRVANSMQQEGIKMDRKVRTWFDSEGIGEAEKAKERQPDTAYCYKTLAEISCYAYPLEGEEARLRGKQVPPQKEEERMPANHLPYEYSQEVVLIDQQQPLSVRELPKSPNSSMQPYDLSK